MNPEDLEKNVPVPEDSSNEHKEKIDNQSSENEQTTDKNEPIIIGNVESIIKGEDQDDEAIKEVEEKFNDHSSENINNSSSWLTKETKIIDEGEGEKRIEMSLQDEKDDEMNHIATSLRIESSPMGSSKEEIEKTKLEFEDEPKETTDNPNEIKTDNSNMTTLSYKDILEKYGDKEEKDKLKEDLEIVTDSKEENITKESEIKKELSEKNESLIGITGEKKEVSKIEKEYIESAALNSTDPQSLVSYNALLQSSTEESEKLENINNTLTEEIYTEENNNETELNKVDIDVENEASENSNKEEENTNRILESSKEETDKLLPLHGGKDCNVEDKLAVNLVSPITKKIRALEPKSTYKTEMFDPNNNLQISSIESSKSRNVNRIKTALLASAISIVTREYQFTEQSDLTAELLKHFRIYENESGQYNLRQRNAAYYRLRLAQLMSIYDHIEYIIDIDGKEKSKPPFEQLMSMIKYPDLEQLFFAVYAATFRFINSYNLKCENLIVDKNGKLTQEICGHEFVYKTDNESIQYSLNSAITMEDLRYLRKGIFKEGDISENLLKYLDFVRTPYEREPTEFKKTIFIQHIPSLKDYLDTMLCYNKMSTAVDSNGKRIYIFNFDVSDIDEKINGMDDSISALYLKFMMSIKSAKIFTVDTSKTKDKDFDGKLKGYYVEILPNSLEERGRIFDEFYFLSPPEIKELINNQYFKKMMAWQAISHYISGAVCPKCHKPIAAFRIMMESSFFLQLFPGF